MGNSGGTRIAFPSRYACALGIVVSGFIVFFSWFVMRKLAHGLWCGYDQTGWCQFMWTTLHGKMMWGSFQGLSGGSHFAEHVVPAFLSWLPLYALFPFPATLSILQVFLLGIGAIPLFLIAKEKTDNRIALWFVIFYLTNHFVIQAIIEGFQSRIMAIPFYFMAFYFLMKKKYLLEGFFLFWLVMSHGIACLLVGMIGLYMFFVHRKRVLGLFITMASLSWFIISIKVIQPHFGNVEPLKALHFIADGQMISGAMHIVQYFFSHPHDMMMRLFSLSQLDYFLRVFAPLGFLSLFSIKEILIGFPVFLQNMLLSEHLIRMEVPRYTMPLIPILFVSAIHSVAYLSKRMKSAWVYVEVLVVVLWAFSVYRYVWDSTYNPRFQQVMAVVSPETQNHRVAIEKIAKLVPFSASVCADLKAMPFLAHRFNLYDMPYHVKEADYVLIDSENPVFSPKPFNSEEQCQEIMLNELHSSAYTVVKTEDGVVLLKRNP